MNKIILNIAIALCVLLATNCTKDNHIPQAPEGKILSFSLTTSNTSTKAADDPLINEKQIDRLDIFVYDNTGNTCLFYPTAEQIIINNQQSPLSVTVKVPQQTMGQLLTQTGCRVYILANCNISRASLSNLTLDNLKNTIISNSTGYQFNKSVAPQNFFMESNELVVQKFIDELNQNIGSFTLKRAAAKIVLDILSAKVVGYTPGNTKIRITNYLDKTVASSSKPIYTPINTDFKTASQQMIANNDSDHSYSMDLTNPLYTYVNDWSNTNINSSNYNETYIVVEMDWTNQSTLQTKTYYYKIPISYKDLNGNSINKLVRNYIYQYRINISAIGGISPEEALNINANFDIIDWTTRTIETSILSYHYLFVYNSSIRLQNSNTYTWEYKSSLPISYTITNVYSNYYTTDGKINTKVYTTTDPQYPVLTINPITTDNKTTFTIKSMVPINYVPLYITLNIKNGANLSQPVSLTIFPKLYVTAEFSEGTTTNNTIASKVVNGITQWRAGSYTLPTGITTDVGSNNPDGGTGQQNFNFFTVVTKSLDIADELEGIRIGDPTTAIQHPGDQYGYNLIQWRSYVPIYYQTLTSNDGNKIVSPEFVIATQRGITSTDKTWYLGQNRCNTYREGKYPAGSWRMPTLAELKIIRRMQLDNNSAIKELFQSTATSGWWSSLQFWDVVVGQSNDALAIRSQNSTYNSNSVRCVHDTWRDK